VEGSRINALNIFRSASATVHFHNKLNGFHNFMSSGCKGWENGQNDGVYFFTVTLTALRNWQRRTPSSEDLVERLSIRKMGRFSVIGTRLTAFQPAHPAKQQDCGEPHQTEWADRTLAEKPKVWEYFRWTGLGQKT
jgi:hypothetical protein